MVIAGAVILAGCSARPAPLASNSAVEAGASAGIANTCTAVSIVQSNADSAAVLLQQGKLDAPGYADMISPLSVDLEVLIHRKDVGFRDQVNSLIDAIPRTPEGTTSPQFAPTSSAYRRAMTALVTSCADAHAAVVGVDATGGG